MRAAADALLSPPSFPRAPSLLLRAQLNPVRDFVAVSKLGRRAVELDKQLLAVAASRRGGAATPAVAYTLAYLHLALIAALALAYWGVPLAHLPAGWYTPFGFLLAFSAGAAGGGHLGILPWSCLCSFAADSLLHAAALWSGVLVPPPAATWMSMLLGSD